MRNAMKVLCTGALILSGAAAAHVAAESPAPMIRACVSGSGNVRILLSGGTCKANETLLEWSTGDVPPPPSSSGDGAALRVMNVLGEEVGPLLGPSMAVLTLPNGQRAYAELYPGGPAANWLVGIYYASADCSGEGFVSWTYLEELLPAALVRRNGVWALRPGTVAPRTVGSYHLVGDNGPGACTPFAATIDTWAFDFYTPEALGLLYPLSVQPAAPQP